MFFRFPLDTDAEVNTTLQAFAAAGISARRGVDALLHREAGLSDAAFAGAAATFHRTVSLPIRPQLTDADVDRIVHVARRIFGAE
jgi:dTDP-4-amino-4,6-dideoxygalactose transaminase